MEITLERAKFERRKAKMRAPMEELDQDLELLRTWYSGSKIAGDALYRRHEAPLRRSFERKVPPQDVDEVVQQTWMALTENKRKANGASPEIRSVRAYILGVARHIVFAYYRKKGEKSEFDPEVDSLEAIAPSISQQLSLRRNVQRVELAMQSLPLEFQLIAEAHYLEELTGPEIAEMFGIPEGTVRSRLRRAKATIEEVMRRWDIRMGNPAEQ